MKGKKILSVLLALALAVGLAAPALAAPNFTDLPENHWGRKYILDMADRGLFEGYGNNQVGPNDPINYSAALSLCARMAVPDLDIRLQLAADRAQELDDILGESALQWFRKEAATCLELNIVSHDELASLAGAGRLTEKATRVDFAKYVVRAMGVEDMIRSTGSDVTLSFADAAQIPADMRPYVDLLYQWGIISGSPIPGEPGRFNFRPNSTIIRAECAKMLSLSIQSVETRGISVELARFTKYGWTAGYIENVEPDADGRRVVYLSSPFDGTQKAITLPAGVKIYRYNQPAETPVLQVGAFARICYAADGVTPESVRVTPRALLSAASGACEELTPNEIVVAGQTYTIDRFTQVSAGGGAGDRNNIDYNADYTDVTLTHDAKGVVIHMALSGGTRRVNGILSDVTVTTTAGGSRTDITVTGYNGVTSVYQVPAAAAVTVGGVASELREALEGKHISLRVSDSDPTQVVAVEVDVTTRYLQGILDSVDAKSTPRTVQITPTGGKSARYDLSSDCSITYMGAELPLDKLPGGTFVTVRLEGGTLTWITGYQGYETTTGTLTSITYGDPTVLQVTPEAGTAVTFSVAVDQLKNITVTYSGKKSDITALRAGDQVSVTLLYNKVAEIEATPQQANVVGTLQAVTLNADGSVQLSLLFADGSSAMYIASSSVTVTREGEPASLSDIRAGSAVALVANGTQALSIELSGASQTKDQIYGTVFQTDSVNRTVTLLVKDPISGQETLKKLSIPANVTIQNVSGGTVQGVSRLELGNILRAWGKYDQNGVFVATLVVREG